MSIIIHHILISAEIVDEQKRTPVQIAFTLEEATNPKAPGSVHEMFKWAKFYIRHSIVDRLPAAEAQAAIIPPLPSRGGTEDGVPEGS
jgi:hypothetical protein